MANSPCPRWELSLPLASLLSLEKRLFALAPSSPAGAIRTSRPWTSLEARAEGAHSVAGGLPLLGAGQGVTSLPPETTLSRKRLAPRGH
jgi:hypothetical protein